MSENRETWEKALERGFRATEDMSDALMGRGQGDLDTVEDVFATLRATIETLTAERDAALSSLGCLQMDANERLAAYVGARNLDGCLCNECVRAITRGLDRADEMVALCTETEGSEG